ncbi:hypothetical protein RB195_000988 [Necator americanus]|uniref:Mos1 transposase HTH domain-containing protein n=1 Tax=Necator americanus TaxID=51031 RepID=A0ABR1DCQ3_NECAM
MAEHSTNIRHVLLYEFESGHPAAEAHRNLSRVFGTEAPSEQSVCAWLQRFKAGNKKLEDEPRSGRPTAISFDEVKNLAKQHPYEGARYFAAGFGLADKIRKEHPKLENVRLLHDNVRPHIAKKTSQKILELGWGVLPHSPYRPDLAPSDYYLFRSHQHHLEEKRYDDPDHLENDYRAFFASKSPEFYAKGIRDLVRRWQKVVDVDGDYFVE